MGVIKSDFLGGHGKSAFLKLIQSRQSDTTLDEDCSNFREVHLKKSTLIVRFWTSLRQV